MIGDIGATVGKRVLRRLGRVSGRVQERRDLPADLLERDDEFLAVFDAPGANAEDVQVRFADGRILVRVERFREFHEGFEMRLPGRGLSLEGEVVLPEDADVDVDGATATVTEAGTLEVRIPRAAD